MRADTHDHPYRPLDFASAYVVIFQKKTEYENWLVLGDVDLTIAKSFFSVRRFAFEALVDSTLVRLSKVEYDEVISINQHIFYISGQREYFHTLAI